MDIRAVDKNFENRFSFEGTKTYDIEEYPFRLFGFCRESGETDFKRMPHAVANRICNDGVKQLYTNTAGIRLRFKTDSKRIILSCVLPDITTFPHMPMTGTSCFDLYANGRYCSVFRPGIDTNGNYSQDQDISQGYSSGYVFETQEEREILIHFPLYNNVSKVYISLDEEASLAPCEDYKNQKPIVYYGSSITQGGCASHPGNCYSAILSRQMNVDFINLGFSGSCLAGEEMAAYIGGLDISVLVLAYDHNAPTAEFLQKTHEPFFKCFRRYQPNTPVIMLSAADLSLGLQSHKARKEVIKRTYQNACASGDRNVHFLDGDGIYADVGLDFCTVDNVHPNDLGFWCIAKAVGTMLRAI